MIQGETGDGRREMEMGDGSGRWRRKWKWKMEMDDRIYIYIFISIGSKHTEKPRDDAMRWDVNRIGIDERIWSRWRVWMVTTGLFVFVFAVVHVPCPGPSPGPEPYSNRLRVPFLSSSSHPSFVPPPLSASNRWTPTCWYSSYLGLGMYSVGREPLLRQGK